MGCHNTSSKKKPPQKKKDHKLTDDERNRLENSASRTNIRKIYGFEQVKTFIVLGTGGFGTVKLAHMRTNVHKQCAIKIIDKKNLKDRQYLLLRELEILKTLDHPNIIKFYEIYQDDLYFYIVMQYCAGGELAEKLARKKHKFMSEHETAKILNKIFNAVNHMHKNGVVHRDLKPENVLFTTHDDNDPNQDLKIIDFGLSNKFHETVTLTTQVGTPLYVAPEILIGTAYDSQCDIWSLGVIMYVLLSGYPPFLGETKQKTFEKIENGLYQMQSVDWQKKSPESKDLIKKLLEKNTKMRLTASEALKHVWFQHAQKRQQQQATEEDQEVQNHILKNLKNYEPTSKFKKEVMKVFVNHLTESEIQQLKNAFIELDKDKTGILRLDELTQAIDKSPVKLSSNEVIQIIKRISPDNGNGELSIRYSEFIAATLDQKKYLTKQRLWGLFQYFDVSSDGFINVNDLKNIFQRNGIIKSEDEIQNIIKEVDLDNEGKISFENFLTMMRGEDFVQDEKDLFNDKMYQHNEDKKK